MTGVCGCVCGPPHDGSPCNACGARRFVPGCAPPTRDHHHHHYHYGLSEADVRRIVREELDRMKDTQK